MATPARIVASAQITKNPRVCGGKACLDQTRIRVMDIVELEREGKKPEEMQDIFSVHLSLAQVYLALAYAADHPEEIEADFADGRRVEVEIDRDRAAYLKARGQ